METAFIARMASVRLEIRVLGELAVLADGEALALPQSKKTRALLAFLALNPGPHRRERLCELFWEVPDDPRGSLRWSLSKLRPLVDLGRERVVADRERVALDVADAAIDLLRLEEKARNGFAAAGPDELAALAEASRGSFLEGLDLPNQPEFEAWRVARREDARMARAAVLSALVARLPDDDPERIRRLADLTEAQPYEASAHLELVRALAAAGRKSEAEHRADAARRRFAGMDDIGEDALARVLAAPPGAPRQPSRPRPLQQEIRFCRSGDGVQIAWSSVGDGPPLVKTANWLNHLEFDWESPVWRHIFHAFSEDHRFLRYDARGNGLSDWDAADLSFERMVNDLEAVVDAAGLERFPLFGISQGCAIAVEYAARHPERVTRLLLYGGYARGWRIEASEKMLQTTEAMLTLMRIGWGQDNPAFRDMFTSQFMPDAPLENRQWFNELQRMTTAPEHACRLLHTLGAVDVRARLSEIRHPTLVAHCRRDARVPHNLGRELATGIEGARFLTLESSNHLMHEADPAWPVFLKEARAFLAEDCGRTQP